MTEQQTIQQWPVYQRPL